MISCIAKCLKCLDILVLSRLLEILCFVETKPLYTYIFGETIVSTNKKKTLRILSTYFSILQIIKIGLPRQNSTKNKKNSRNENEVKLEPIYN